MMSDKVQIVCDVDGNKHELLLIEFGRNGLPFAVFTSHDGCQYQWDFDLANKQLEYRCSGVGCELDFYLEHGRGAVWVADRNVLPLRGQNDETMVIRYLPEPWKQPFHRAHEHDGPF